MVCVPVLNYTNLFSRRLDTGSFTDFPALTVRSDFNYLIGHRTNLDEWMRDKTSRLTPKVQVQRTRSAFRRRAQRNAFRRRGARQHSGSFARWNQSLRDSLNALAFFSRRQDRELLGAISRGLLDCSCRV
jgi:hypothetical protein